MYSRLQDDDGWLMSPEDPRMSGDASEAEKAMDTRTPHLLSFSVSQAPGLKYWGAWGCLSPGTESIYAALAYKPVLR